MIKVLILAYDFPPYVSVGGLRPYSWYKYLHEFGIEPVVVTRQWTNNYGNHLDYIDKSESAQIIIETSEFGTIIKTPYSPNYANRLMLKHGESKYTLIRKTISAYYEFAQWIWNVGPKSQLYFAARDYLKTNKVDAIIATGDPFILFKYASKLSKEFDTPWIADYRDAWSQDKSNSRNLFLKIWNTYLERKYVKHVSRITTVSDFFISQISQIIQNKQFTKILNGYDSEVVSKIDLIQQKSDVLRIGFIGTISKWHPIESFIQVLAGFISENPDSKIEVNFYGINIKDELEQIIASKYSMISSLVNIYPRIPNDQLLKELARNNVMLLFNYYSIIGTKIYDYLAIKRAILLCYANDPEAIELKEKYYIAEDILGQSSHLQEDLIIETNAGYIAQDAFHLKVLMGQLCEEIVQTGVAQCHTHNVAQFSRKNQAGNLADVIKKINDNE